MNGSEDNPADEEWNDMERHKEQTIYTHCNVCGILLKTEDEERMGMCERCAAEGP